MVPGVVARPLVLAEKMTQTPVIYDKSRVTQAELIVVYNPQCPAPGFPKLLKGPARVSIRYSCDNWRHARQRSMDTTDDGLWQITLSDIDPITVSRIELVFTDRKGHWDNNGERDGKPINYCFAFSRGSNGLYPGPVINEIIAEAKILDTPAGLIQAKDKFNADSHNQERIVRMLRSRGFAQAGPCRIDAICLIQTARDFGAILREESPGYYVLTLTQQQYESLRSGKTSHDWLFSHEIFEPVTGHKMAEEMAGEFEKQTTGSVKRGGDIFRSSIILENGSLDPSPVFLDSFAQSAGREDLPVLSIIERFEVDRFERIDALTAYCTETGPAGPDWFKDCCGNSDFARLAEKYAKFLDQVSGFITWGAKNLSGWRALRCL